MILTGKLIVIGEIQTFESGFSKREIVIETPGDYPQKIKIELLKDKADQVTDDMKGKSIDVHIDIRGREYQKEEGAPLQYFNSIIGWRVENASVEADPVADDGKEPDDGLPF